jgi:hypothetical protein
LSTQADKLHCLLAFAKEAAASKKDNIVFLFVSRSLCSADRPLAGRSSGHTRTPQTLALAVSPRAQGAPVWPSRMVVAPANAFRTPKGFEYSYLQDPRNEGLTKLQNLFSSFPHEKSAVPENICARKEAACSYRPFSSRFSSCARMNNACDSQRPKKPLDAQVPTSEERKVTYGFIQ